jgi:ATP phosphoribosyltransferase regulatory subunit HisZ
MALEGEPAARLRRALERRDVKAAEQAAFGVPFVPLGDARELVELYAEKGDLKFERAALKYVRRYIDEADPTLADVAQVAALFAERAMLMRGL